MGVSRDRENMAIPLAFRKSDEPKSASNEKRRKLRRRRPRSSSVAVAANGAEHCSDESYSTSEPRSSLSLQDQDKSDGGSQSSIPVSPHKKADTMDDPQQMVIASLRAQISDLISQVTQLNGKLVKSYDRVSDLEDELHVASSSLRTSSLKVSNLELERMQHLAALNTGLLVEKSHVTSELTRLMEKATDEAAARGQAETARTNIEKELDDLSANLFNQANSMVAEARFDKSLSERKAMDAEMALGAAEEVVSSLQLQMQQLRDEKERSTEELERLRQVFGKETYDHPQPTLTSVDVRLLSSHAPYQEFISFVNHMRSLRTGAPHPPHISTMITLPFIARILTEDS